MGCSVLLSTFLAFFLLLLVGVASAEPRLYLAINPLAFTEGGTADGEVIKRRVEVNWYGEQPLPNDYIRLIALNQTFVTFIGDRNYNFYVFPGNLPYPTLDQMGFSATCVFDLRAEWKRLYDDGSEEVIASACLRSEPGWMEEHRENLEELKIGDLMLVGAHDAGAYREYQDIGDDNWATSAVFAQEEDLLHQLIWGVRFLDIRAGFYPTTDERFWLVHGIIKTHPMMEGINDVKEFLANTREIIVWEINGFEQHWTADAHFEYKTLLVEQFGRWLVTPGELGWETSLREIWAREDLPANEGRIIITYNNGGYTDPDFFFREVNERWGNVDEPPALRSYLETEVGNAKANPTSYRPWKPNCQMTPNEEDIIGGRWSGLRQMADAVNRNVTAWWRDDWSDLPSTFPIHDFVRSTNMVQESIERNLRLARMKRPPPDLTH